MGIGWSLHKKDGWQGQLQRIHRWYTRLYNAAASGSGDLEDFAITFFQNCYALRDWVTQTSPQHKLQIDRLFSKTPELRVCRDICNATKHFRITRASVDPELSICREYDPSATHGYRLCVIAGDKYDVLDLSLRCLTILDNFVAPTQSDDDQGT